MQSLIQKTKDKLNIKDSDKDDDRQEDPDPSEGSVALRIINEGHSTIKIDAWPVKNSKTDGFVLATYHGTHFDDGKLEDGKVLSDDSFVLGSIKKCKKMSLHSHEGWMFFSVVHDDHKRVHMQIWVKLDRKGIQEARLGLLDLGSRDDDPMPDGDLGKVEFTRDGDEIKFYILDDVLKAENQHDLESEKASKIKPGKGVVTSTYVSAEASDITVVAGKDSRYHDYEPLREGQKVHTIRISKHEVELGATHVIELWTLVEGKEWWRGKARLNAVTGGVSGDMVKTFDTKALFSDDGKLTLNYGLHGSGMGQQDQVYVYCCKNQENWLGDLIAENEAWNKVPFSKLALIGSHDSGMMVPEIDAALLQLLDEGKLGSQLVSWAVDDIGVPVVRFIIDALEMIKLSPARALLNIAMTQKDSITDQLRVGVRFFDQRPGYMFTDCIHLKKGEIRHQHALVPGLGYIEYLQQCLDFLASHPKEIIFYEVKSDGFVLREDKMHNGEVAAISMIPTEEALAACLEEARQRAVEGARDIQIGGGTDLDTPIGELIAANKRLIVADRVHHPDAWKRGDSYDHKTYNTQDPATIVTSLEKLYRASSEAEPGSGAIYQLQATPTSNIRSDVAASCTYSDCSSLLTYMKPIQDRITYPWIASHEFKEPGNVIFLNDFCDTAGVEHAIHVSRQRAGL